jgi:hypothetical protein
MIGCIEILGCFVAHRASNMDLVVGCIEKALYIDLYILICIYITPIPLCANRSLK